MVFRAGDGVVRGGRGNKIGRDNFRALVYKLVEGVLAVGTRCTPDDGLRGRMRKYNKKKEQKTITR